MLDHLKQRNKMIQDKKMLEKNLLKKNKKNQNNLDLQTKVRMLKKPKMISKILNHLKLRI